MSLLDLVPTPYRLASEFAFVGLLLAGCAWFVHYERDYGRREGRSEVQAKWDAQTTETARLAAKETQRRLDAQEVNQRAHDQELAAAQRDAAGARLAADRLRSQLSAFVAASRDPAAGVNGAPTADPIGVLADVLGRADKRAGVLAAYADAARAAGLQCERNYDSLKAKP